MPPRKRKAGATASKSSIAKTKATTTRSTRRSTRGSASSSLAASSEPAPSPSNAPEEQSTSSATNEPPPSSPPVPAERASKRQRTSSAKVVDSKTSESTTTTTTTTTTSKSRGKNAKRTSSASTGSAASSASKGGRGRKKSVSGKVGQSTASDETDESGPIAMEVEKSSNDPSDPATTHLPEAPSNPDPQPEPIPSPIPVTSLPSSVSASLEAAGKVRGASVLSLADMAGEPLTAVSASVWAPGAPADVRGAYLPELITTLWSGHLAPSVRAPGRVLLLELSRYLEDYLWPHWDPERDAWSSSSSSSSSGPSPSPAVLAHALSIAVLVNAKVAQGIPPWTWIGAGPTGASPTEAVMAKWSSLWAFWTKLPSSVDWNSASSHSRKSSSSIAAKAAELAEASDDPTVAENATLGSSSSPSSSSSSSSSSSGSSIVSLTSLDKALIMQILSAATGSLSHALLARSVLSLHSIDLLASIPTVARDALLTSAPSPKLAKAWKGAAKRARAAGGTAVFVPARDVVPTLVRSLYTALSATNPSKDDIVFMERALEWMVEVLAQVHTRRFVTALFAALGVVPVLTHASSPSSTCTALIASVVRYMHYPLTPLTGSPLSRDEADARATSAVTAAQSLAWAEYRPSLEPFALATVYKIQSPGGLAEILAEVPTGILDAFAQALGYIHTEADQAALPVSMPHHDSRSSSNPAWRNHIIHVLEDALGGADRGTSASRAAQKPLYPTEATLWDPALVPDEAAWRRAGGAAGAGPPLALPKLGLQFLSARDYLERSFALYQVEATYALRGDIEDAVRRAVRGFARMAIPASAVKVASPGPQKLGTAVPSYVNADISLDLSGMRASWREEWEGLSRHDVIFIVALSPPQQLLQQLQHPQGNGQQGKKGGPGSSSSSSSSSSKQGFLRSGPGFPKAAGVLAVRGAEVIELRTPNADNPADGRRVLRVHLDPAQWIADGGSRADYSGFNLIIRRNAKENNFKSILATVASLLGSDAAVPEWLHEVFLGYGDPAAAHYTALPEALPTVDFLDTFLDTDHVLETFGGNDKVTWLPTETRGPVRSAGPALGAAGSAASSSAAMASLPSSSSSSSVDETGMDPVSLNNLSAVPSPPFRVSFDDGGRAGGKDVVVQPYVRRYNGPYPQDQFKANKVRFTPVQAEAIRSGTNKGLTLVVGPPGTGKTDVAVQILNTIYHNFPTERTLIITHSNNALNQIFEKASALDIHERYMLRLGRGEEDLDTAADFSKHGRINYMLALRMDLLSEAARLADALGVPGAAGDTCETAHHFFNSVVLGAWEKYHEALVASTAGSRFASAFPFHKFFSNIPGWVGADGTVIGPEGSPPEGARVFAQGKDGGEGDSVVAEGAWAHIRSVFDMLEECRAFELLRSSVDRGNYLVTSQAKIIAMTTTHAAMKRDELVKLGFKFDNVLMEEAAQVMEVEAFIPLLCQERSSSRLKRLVLIGDHHQLPPIVQHAAAAKVAGLEQSLFTRLIRLGVPHIQLDAQGRARPSLAALYSWRYRSLGNLPHVTRPNSEYSSPNPGFAHHFQFVDVPDLNGVGESTPSAFFYQNLAEAEYVVAVYMWMRSRGYPADKIAMLTTYNGQKALLHDVVAARCGPNTPYGSPGAIATVDQFQGQQADYVLLSLVRTKHVGHIRDVRRAVVAFSRARLGLYVFGRRSLFQNCFELAPSMQVLLSKPTDALELIPTEVWGQPGTLKERGADGTEGTKRVESLSEMGKLVYSG